MSVIDHGFSISLVTGRGGDGKSYMVVDELVHHRLVSWDYELHTNLPLHVDKIARHVAEQRGCEPEEVAARIHKIPDEQLAAWAEARGGPWDLCGDDGRHLDIVIDEIHVFCPKRGRRREVVDDQGRPVIGPKQKPVTEEGHLAWERFLGEARHHGVQRFQAITQDLSKLHPVIQSHASVRYGMEKTDRRRAAVWGVQMADVYELLASITGRYQPLVKRVEEVKDAHGRWKHNDTLQFVYHKRVFELYESHSAAGGKSSVESSVKQARREFERRPRLLVWPHDYRGNGKKELTAPTWLWAVWRNQRPFWIMGGGLAFCTFLFGGGIEWMMTVPAERQRHRVLGERAQPEASKDASSNPDPVERPAVAAADAAEDDEGCGCGGNAKRLVRSLAEHVERRLEDDRVASSVVAIGRGFVAFASGHTYRVGEIIDHGVYEGSRLDAIDFSYRRIRVDGEWLRFGPPPEGLARQEAEVRGLLQQAREVADAPAEEGATERSVLVSRRTQHEAEGRADARR